MTKSRGVAKRYTREEITEALQLAAYYRSTEKAARHLKDEGRPVPAATILSWRTKHPEIHEQCLTRIDEVLAERSEELVQRATELELTLLDDILVRKDELDPKDLSNTLRNVSVTKGIAFERVVGPIRGRPNVVVELKEPTKLLERMAQIAAAVRPAAVESSAEEIGEAEVLEAGEE